MLKNIIILIAVLLMFTSCSDDYEKKLKISATTWIGYTPLFYAKEKGWLIPLNIKLLHVSSLSENMYLYEAGNSDAYVGTQYEYNLLSKKDDSLKPIMMFDRSFGGDIIMSNFSIKALQDTNKTIDAYLEMDSINNTMLKDFIKSYNLQNSTINYINKDQSQIRLLKTKDTTQPTLVVTYVPYNYALKKNGFKEIVSTKEGLDIFVIDAMFTKTDIFHKHEKQFRELKTLVNSSVIALKKDPKEFYETIKPYMLDMSYNEFIDSLDDIIWINQGLSTELKQRMYDSKFPTRDLI